MDGFVPGGHRDLHVPAAPVPEGGKAPPEQPVPPALTPVVRVNLKVEHRSLGPVGVARYLAPSNQDETQDFTLPD